MAWWSLVCLHITSLSSLCRRIWRYWTSIILSSVCLRLSQFSQVIFHAIYGAVCIQLTHLSYDDCVNTCTLSYHHHQIGSMTQLPLALFRVRSWNNGMCCMSFYILTIPFVHVWLKVKKKELVVTHKKTLCNMRYNFIQIFHVITTITSKISEQEHARCIPNTKTYLHIFFVLWVFFVLIYENKAAIY